MIADQCQGRDAASPVESIWLKSVFETAQAAAMFLAIHTGKGCLGINDVVCVDRQLAMALARHSPATVVFSSRIKRDPPGVRCCATDQRSGPSVGAVIGPIR